MLEFFLLLLITFFFRSNFWVLTVFETFECVPWFIPELMVRILYLFVTLRWDLVPITCNFTLWFSRQCISLSSLVICQIGLERPHEMKIWSQKKKKKEPVSKKRRKNQKRQEKKPTIVHPLPKLISKKKKKFFFLKKADVC